MFRLLPTLFAPLLVACAAIAADLPADVSREAWFIDRCRPLSERRMTHYGDVQAHRISYAWQSDIGYLWDWEHGTKAGNAAHYCTRLALYRKNGRLIENITMICSVSDKGQQTEVWMFGNHEMTGRLCPLDADRLKEMDERAPKP